ncbi:MAG: hypothetical protein ABSG11_22030 [Candidatus Korobacteraceae bacterium]
MKNFAPSILRLGVAAILAVWLITPAMAQQSPSEQTGAPDDWSHHHVIFSNPGNEQDALNGGKYDEWIRIVNDPRYVMQQLKRGAPAQGPSAADVERIEELARLSKTEEGQQSMEGAGGQQRGTRKIKKDWSMDLGSAAKVGAGQYPAILSAYTSANCDSQSPPDFAVFNTGLAGGASQPTIIAYDNLYSGCSGAHPLVYWQFNTAYPQGSMTGDSSVIATSVVLSDDGSQVAFIQHNGSNVASLVILKWAKNSSLVQMDTSSNNVTPANYRSCTAPCMTRITLSGSPNPNSTNSPPYPDYGHDTLYVGDNSGKLHKFTGVFVGTPAESASNGWPVTVSSQTSKILTAPVYDPNSTLVFVGDSTGYLYSVTTTGSSSQTVVPSARIAAGTGIVDSPIVDSTPSTPVVYAFVGDDNTTTQCVNSSDDPVPCNGVYQFPTNFTSGSSGTESTAFAVGTTTETVYIGAFDEAHYVGNGTTGNLYFCAGDENVGTTPTLYQIVMNATFTGTASQTATPASSAGQCSPITEISNSDAASTTLSSTMSSSTTTAHLTSGTGFNNGDYIRIASETMLISSGGGTTTLTVSRGQLGTTRIGHASGAFVADIGTQDWMFLSVTAGGSDTGCTGPCLYNYNALGTASSATAGLAETGGTSGITIDNTLTFTGASQIYFSSLANETCAGNGTTGSGTGGCAVQASQAAP